MSQALIDDDLWTQIEPLLPTRRSRNRQHAGRKPIPDRAMGDVRHHHVQRGRALQDEVARETLRGERRERFLLPAATAAQIDPGQRSQAAESILQGATSGTILIHRRHQRLGAVRVRHE